MTHRSLFSGILTLLVVGMVAAVPVMGLESPASRVLLLDVNTNTVLFEKNADAAAPPASMSKLMTLYMLFERLADGGLSLTDTFSVSEKAWRMGGSKMFVRVNSPDFRRGSHSRNCRSVGQRRLHRGGRGVGRDGTSVRGGDDTTRTRDRPRKQHVSKRKRLARCGPCDVGA